MASLINPNKRTAEDLCGSAGVNVGDSTASASRKVAKRAPEATPTNPDNLHLPAPVWGHVLDYMPYEEVRSALLICKMVATDAVKYVHTLNVTRACQMDIPSARKFPNVEDLNCLCLISKAVNPAGIASHKITLSEEVASKMLPFLGAFPRLDNVDVGSTYYKSSFGGIVREYYYHDHCVAPKNHAEIMRSLIVGVLGAYKTRMFAKPSTRIYGIFHAFMHVRPCLEDDVDAPCSFCRDVCKYFPAEDLLPGYIDGNVCLNYEEFYKLMAQRFSRSEIFKEYAVDKLADIVCDMIKNCTFGYRENEFEELQAVMDKMTKLGLGGDDLANISYIDRTGLAHIDRFIEIGVDPKDVSKTYLYDMLEIGMFKDRRNEVYAKGTFDALVSRGFPLNKDDFILLEERAEAGLEFIADRIDHVDEII